MEKIKTILQMIAIIISLMGITTFSSFICEEAFQTVMFGTWPAQDAKDWRLVKTGLDIQEKIIFWQKFVNWGFGWVQPLGFVAYNVYIKASEYHILGLSAKVFAYCPECFDGEEVTFTFRPQRIEDGTAIAHQVRVEFPPEVPPTLAPVVVRGTVRVEGQNIRIQALSIKAVSE